MGLAPGYLSCWEPLAGSLQRRKWACWCGSSSLTRASVQLAASYLGCWESLNVSLQSKKVGMLMWVQQSYQGLGPAGRQLSWLLSISECILAVKESEHVDVGPTVWLGPRSCWLLAPGYLHCWESLNWCRSFFCSLKQTHSFCHLSATKMSSWEMSIIILDLDDIQETYRSSRSAWVVRPAQKWMLLANLICFWFKLFMSGVPILEKHCLNLGYFWK